MAHTTYTLRATKFGYVNEEDAYTHYPVVDGHGYKIGGQQKYYDRHWFYIGFEDLPDSIKRCQFIGAQLTLRCLSGYGSASIGDNWLFTAEAKATEDFDANSITFESRPDDVKNATVFANPMFYRANGQNYYEITSPDVSNLQIERFGALAAARSLTIRLSNYYTSNTFLNNWCELATTLSDNERPCLIVHYDDSVFATSQVVYTQGAINNSYADPRLTQKFGWKLGKGDSITCVTENFIQTSAIFYWKVQGADTWNTVAVSGDVKEVTIPANTFPVASTIVWKVEATDMDNTTTATQEFSFSTADTLAKATLIAPVSSVEDGSAPITFRWTLSNASGTTPTLVNLWWKLPEESNQNWHTIVSSTTPITSYTVPANYFQAGEIQWLVHAYNIDDVRGPDSKASFICVAAPQPPTSLNSDNAPFTTFTWQSGEQQAFRVVVDGVEVAKEFGTQKSYTLEDYLTDGQHTVSVQVQGNYGLWSQASELTFTVQNNPYYALNLAGEFGIDAALSITPGSVDISIDSTTATTGYRIRVSSKALVTNNNCYVSDYIPVEPGQTLYFSWILDSNSYGHCWYNSGKTALEAFPSSNANRTVTVPEGVAYIRVTGFLTGLNTDYITITPQAFGTIFIYRDGVRIGRTTSSTFTDRFSIGEHSYYSIARLSDGNYTKSNTVVGTTESDTLQISDLYSPGWVELRLSANSNNVQTYNHSRVYITRHINGAVYPLLELSPFEDETVKYNVAFKNGSDLRLIEQFRGKPVITKYRGEMVIGVMTGMAKTVNDFYTIYSFGVERIHWEDFIDDTNS